MAVVAAGAGADTTVLLETSSVVIYFIHNCDLIIHLI